MIITQTPVRMSFVGGGSDLPAFYRQHGGAVISTAVDKYIYITVNRKFDQRIRVSYSKTEEADQVDQIEHRIVRASLHTVGIPGGVEITSVADIPSQGTGLGSSSSFTVGLLHALHVYRNRYISAADLAAQACAVEIDRCGARIGRQDQYAAAFGGFNFMRFYPDDTVTVDPIVCEREVIRCVERHVLVFYTGVARSASAILENQSDLLEQSTAAQKIQCRMVHLACMLRDELQGNNLHAFGEILHENWMLKKEITAGITTSAVDDWYARGRCAGAIGGKLLGAGGGGFLMFFAPPERHPAIERALPGLRRVDFGFENRGSRVILFQ